MNDKYLYRAKRTDNGEWVYGSVIYIDDCAYIICDAEIEDYDTVSADLYATEWYRVDPSTICQCTGLNDKNGKLIWENDIVDFFGHKGKVKYECGGFGIAYRECIDWEEIESNICTITRCDNALYACENDNYISLWEIYWNFNDEDDCLSTVEVVGSAIDNPELLE